ncbi:phosphoribosylanthranilate isomerase [Campylobacter jejuni]|uniref:N-(5'-phosphoribosyl)anthranilate isomerase n=1 Tax=Campylobacter jejuni TaxID=197 RepID=A0A5Y6TJ79_CAMJU|nr:N-(5'-phosphoribosyl)anthranilate isomerase [Campylobacter jejuni]AXL28253.1 N-(5'-phosphoribosyl)anthranilate isomerase [Campylobacter jejuni]EAH6315386.1 phosphoribosylanthranilate isomerase [Campylobacter jejuni]EAH9245405.1 phosphoribosylanthranilate isomerase [Campylobacter jejuni]EAI1225029.1 phosphoribosylanthranilate isomerase [Campylobacter jejuni]EAI1812475.1 phosphoribosylanthranilate isomerase [Campylobacter jejuni]
MLKLKICGIKDEKNAKDLAFLNIDFFGFIFAESPRRVSLEQARNLSAIFHEKDKKVVGVFVDENLEQILRCIKEAKLDGIQIYRTITKEEFEILKVQNVFVWQVISVENSLDLKSEIFANLVLFDAKGILKGGNGISFDWTLLGSYTKDFILAGGIGLDNVHKAVQTGAKILDLNSKLEDEKGLKDINKIKQILKELKK